MWHRSLLFFLLLTLGAPLARGSLVVPAYRIGEVAPADVITPIEFTVIDPERTRALQEREAPPVPALFRFAPSVGVLSELELRQHFTNAHTAFLHRLTQVYNRSLLGIDTIREPLFDQVIEQFARDHMPFPLGSELARLWALGASGALVLEQWTGQLRAAQGQAIIREWFPAHWLAGLSDVRIVSVPSLDTPMEPSRADREGISFDWTDIVLLSEAQEDGARTFPFADAATARFLATFLRVNCVFDESSTLELRAARTEPIFAADHYRAGEVILRRGEVVDAKLAHALDELRLRLAADQARREAFAERAGATAALKERDDHVLAATQTVQAVELRNRWLWIGWALCAGAALLAFIRWRGTRSARIGRRLEPGAIEVLSPGEFGTGEGATRALAASEARLISTAARRKLFPHLARWLTQRFVRQLLRERNELLEGQRTAQEEVAEIELRLMALHAPLTERLKTYEERIRQLERDLAAKGEENRQLIEAKIQLTRQKLATERGQQKPPSWN